MGKMNLNNLEERREFAEEFLPPGMGFEWRFAEPNETLPLTAPTATCFRTSVGNFKEGGLRLPLDPLFLEMMKTTNLPFNCLGLNLVRIISSIAAFNKRHESHLGLKEVWYYSMLVGRNHTYYLSPHKISPELIKGLPTSAKNVTSRLIVVTKGPVLPEGYESFSFPCFTEKMTINPPKRPSPSEINFRDLSMALSHEGYGSGSIATHPRAYHNLIKVTSQYTNVSSRKAAEIWVGPPMDPKDMLLLFTRHGIEHPPTKQLEDKLRRICLQEDAEGANARELLAQVEGERAKYEAYLDDLKRAGDSHAKIVRERTEAKVGGLTLENAAPLEVMRRWGFMGPLVETPVPTSSRTPSASNVDSADLSIRGQLKLQKKADKKAAKMAAKRAKVKEEANASEKVNVEEDSAVVTVVEPPLAMAMIASPQVQRQRRAYVDLGDDDEEVRGDDQVPSVEEEDDGSLRHREKRRRTDEGEPSGARTGAHVLGEDEFTAEDTVLDLDTASRLGKYILLPGDLKSFEGHTPDEILSYITAHALATHAAGTALKLTANAMWLVYASPSSSYKLWCR